MSYLKEFTKGIIKENPVLVTLLGMCPTLAITTLAEKGVGMGLATTFVLLGSNIVISLLKNVIPKSVRLPSYIVIIAGFVTLIEFLMKGYLPELYDSLGIFLSLITVNCIILGRAEVFASKNNVVKSILDALGMGIGFTFALFLMGSIREIFGAGTWFGISISAMPATMNLIVRLAAGLLGLAGIILLCLFSKSSKEKLVIRIIMGVLGGGMWMLLCMTISTSAVVFAMPAGGFFVLGVIIAVVNKITKPRFQREIGCACCPNASICNPDVQPVEDKGGEE